MQVNGHFALFDNVGEFNEWLQTIKVTRTINILQVHHTWEPSYDNFKGSNHFQMLESMRNSHIGRGFDDIAQNLTTFPDGRIAYSSGRPFDKVPAGIVGANSTGICIENIGNFDKNGDTISQVQKDCIASLYAVLALKFNVPIDTNHIVYHCWYTASGTRLSDYTAGKSAKTCPGTNFLGQGNTIAAANLTLIPMIKIKIEEIQNKQKVVKQIMQSISKYFSDVDAKWSVDAIDRGKERGIFTVPPDKAFHPTDNITRQEFAVALDRAIDFIINHKE